MDDDEYLKMEGDADTLAGLMLEIKGDFPVFMRSSITKIIPLR
jgi:hypothetical protein